MSIEELKNKLMANKKFAKEYERIDLAFEVSELVFEARLNAGLSQAALAKKVGTKQSSIARIESGASLPSLSFLEKIAKALKLELLPPRFRTVSTRGSNALLTSTSTSTSTAASLSRSIRSPWANYFFGKRKSSDQEKNINIK